MILWWHSNIFKVILCWKKKQYQYYQHQHRILMYLIAFGFQNELQFFTIVTLWCHTSKYSFGTFWHTRKPFPSTRESSHIKLPLAHMMTDINTDNWIKMVNFYLLFYIKYSNCIFCILCKNKVLCTKTSMLFSSYILAPFPAPVTILCALWVKWLKLVKL